MESPDRTPSPHSLQEGLGEPLSLLRDLLGPVPLTLYLCKALCGSFLGGGGWAGRGWGRFSPLSLSVGQEVLSPSPWIGVQETFWGQHFWSGKYI